MIQSTCFTGINQLMWNIIWKPKIIIYQRSCQWTKIYNPFMNILIRYIRCKILKILGWEHGRNSRKNLKMEGVVGGWRGNKIHVGVG